jgi:hypothetical protein
VIRTEFGTGAKELIQAIEKGPPYVVHFHWAGGDDRRERRVVTEALASCFGVNDLGAVQTIPQHHEALGSLEYRVEYAFWLLRIFDLSLGFTHGWECADVGSQPGTADGSVYRISMRVDRSRYRGYDES